jgi:MarR family transcriptional regulator for hemolysin
MMVVGVSRLWRQRLDERLRPLGLSQAKWAALYRLARLERAPTQAELAAELGVEGPTVARLLARLEASGHIERRPSPADRRLKVVHLTARARGEAARIDRIAGKLRAELLLGLDPAAVEATWQVLHELQHRLEVPPAPRGTRPSR